MLSTGIVLSAVAMVLQRKYKKPTAGKFERSSFKF
jgi:hypothetical protein